MVHRYQHLMVVTRVLNYRLRFLQIPSESFFGIRNEEDNEVLDENGVISQKSFLSQIIVQQSHTSPDIDNWNEEAQTQNTFPLILLKQK